MGRIESFQHDKRKRLAVLGFGISTLLLILIGVALYISGQRVRLTSALGDRSRQVLGSLASIDADVARSQSAQRGYALFREERFLRQSDAALDSARSDVEGLQRLSGGVALDGGRIQELEALLRGLAGRMRRATAEWRAGKQPREPAPGLDPSETYSSSIYALTAAMREAQLRTLAAIHREEEHHFHAAYALLGVAAVLLFAVLLPVYVTLIRQARSRQRAESRVRELAESLPGAVYQARISPDGSVVYEFLSNSTRSVRGIDPEATLRDARIAMETVHEDDRKIFRESLVRSASRIVPLDIDYRIHHPEKGVRWIRSVAAPALQPDRSIRWSGHWADITTQKEMEAGLLRAMEEAGAASQAKSRFLATVSHEIRTPMNGVLGMLELLSLTRLDQEQAASLAVVRESGRALLRIIDDILDFSKIEAGKMDIAPEPSSIARLVERVVNIHSGVASAKDLALTAFVDPGISPALMFDPVRMQQILGNLLNNAIKFTTRGGVSLTARSIVRRSDEEVVRFEVKDSGIGMTPEEQSRVFEAFTQANASTTQRFGGTGLGLSISRQLTRLMGGAIEMRSRSGVGTEIRVTIPMKVAPAEAIASAPSAAVSGEALSRRPPPCVETAAGDGRLVLVVDDHPINRMVLLKQVNALGYAGETAESGGDALEKWAKGRFAAILLDCNMPEVSGYDVARAIRERERNEGLPRIAIIACTANALVGEAEKCVKAGMDDYLAKPIELARLAGALAKWIPAAPLEAGTLEEVCGGDERVAREALEQFRRCNADDANTLREAVRANRMDEVVATCHRIKGAARTIGARDLAEACAGMETAARAGDAEGVRGGLPRFEREVDRLEAYIGSKGATV